MSKVTITITFKESLSRLYSQKIRDFLLGITVGCPSGRLRKDSLGIGVSIRSEMHPRRPKTKQCNNAKMRVVSINLGGISRRSVSRRE
jgi:hypothetical protein